MDLPWRRSFGKTRSETVRGEDPECLGHDVSGVVSNETYEVKEVGVTS